MGLTQNFDTMRMAKPCKNRPMTAFKGLIQELRSLHRRQCYRVNHGNVAFSSWSMLYQHTGHRNSNKFKTLCQKLASVFGLPVAQTRNYRRNYQIFSSSRKTLKLTFFHRYVLHFKNYLFLMKIYCTMPYKNFKFWRLIT